MLVTAPGVWRHLPSGDRTSNALVGGLYKKGDNCVARLVVPCSSELGQIRRTSSVDVGGLEASAAVAD